MLKILEENYSGIVIKDRKIKKHNYNKIICQNMAQIKKLLPYENSLVVFISSVMADNETYKEREITKKTIENFAFTIAWRFEEAPASPDLKASYLSAVKRCDIFILILKNSISKAVEMEFNIAKKSGKPILIFISKNSLNKTNIVTFLKNEASDIRYKKFDSLSILEIEIFKAIHSEIVLSYRNTLPREYITYSVLLLASFWQSEILIKSWEDSLRTNSYQHFDKHLEELIDSSDHQQTVIERISQGIERALNVTGLINIIEKIREEKEEPDSIDILVNRHGYDFFDNHDNDFLDHHTDDTPDPHNDFLDHHTDDTPDPPTL